MNTKEFIIEYSNVRDKLEQQNKTLIDLQMSYDILKSIIDKDVDLNPIANSIENKKNEVQQTVTTFSILKSESESRLKETYNKMKELFEAYKALESLSNIQRGNEDPFVVEMSKLMYGNHQIRDDPLISGICKQSFKSTCYGIITAP